MRPKLLASAPVAALLGGMASPASAITYAQYTVTYLGTGYESSCNGLSCNTVGPRPITATAVFNVASEFFFGQGANVAYYAPQSVTVIDGPQITSITPTGGSTSSNNFPASAPYTANFTIDPSFDGNGPLPYFDTAHLTGGSFHLSYASPSGTIFYGADARALTITTAFSDTPFRTPLGADVGYSPTPAPEPSMWVMMLIGFGAIGFAMRGRSKVRRSVSFA